MQTRKQAITDMTGSHAYAFAKEFQKKDLESIVKNNFLRNEVLNTFKRDDKLFIFFIDYSMACIGDEGVHVTSGSSMMEIIIQIFPFDNLTNIHDFTETHPTKRH